MFVPVLTFPIASTSQLDSMDSVFHPGTHLTSYVTHNAACQMRVLAASNWIVSSFVTSNPNQTTTENVLNKKLLNTCKYCVYLV